MSVKALTFDTGGTILDWHTGFRDAFAAAGRKHDIERDWAALTNEDRRRTLKAMLNHVAAIRGPAISRIHTAGGHRVQVVSAVIESAKSVKTTIPKRI